MMAMPAMTHSGRYLLDANFTEQTGMSWFYLFPYTAEVMMLS